MDRDGICLNIGCWLDVAPGWKNLDASVYVRLSKIPFLGNHILSAIRAPQFPSAIEYGDLVKGLNLAENSCKLIFASHILEHLSLPDFEIAINNIYFYLQLGGTLRLIVPDLEAYVHKYLTERGDASLSPRAAHNFMRTSFLGETASRRTLWQRFLEVFSNSRHQWMWDEPSLTAALQKQGFKNVKRCKYGDWADEQFAAVENKKRHWDAICLEATK